MKMNLIPIRMMAQSKNAKPRAYRLENEQGDKCGVVRRRARIEKPYHLHASNLHTMFSSRIHRKGTGDKVFQTLKDVREFISDNPEQWWKS